MSERDEDASPRAGEPSPQATALERLDSETIAPVFFAVLFLGTLAALVYVLADYIADAVVAFMLAAMLHRPYEAIRKRLGGRAVAASALTTLIALTSIMVPFVFVGWTLVVEAKEALDRFVGPGANMAGTPLVARVLDRITAIGLPLSRAQIEGGLDMAVSSVQEGALEHGSAIVGNVLGVAFHLLTVLVILFYVLLDGARLRRWIYALSPLPDDEDAVIEQTFVNASRGVVYGNGLGSLAQGIIGGLAMWAAGFESAILWGAIMSLFAFLPLVGIAVVTIPATIVLFLEGKALVAVLFLAFCTAQGLFIENVVKTRLMGSAMRMHDLLVFLSVLGGIGSFGLIGLVYGPLCAMLFIALADLYANRYRPRLALRFARRSTARAADA